MFDLEAAEWFELNPTRTLRLVRKEVVHHKQKWQIVDRGGNVAEFTTGEQFPICADSDFDLMSLRSKLCETGPFIYQRRPRRKITLAGVK